IPVFYTLSLHDALPIYLHTHDTSGNGAFMYARAIDAGVDVVDVAVGSMAGSTSQPSAQSLYHALDGTNKQPKMDIDHYETLSTRSEEHTSELPVTFRSR